MEDSVWFVFVGKWRQEARAPRMQARVSMGILLLCRSERLFTSGVLVGLWLFFSSRDVDGVYLYGLTVKLDRFGLARDDGEGFESWMEPFHQEALEY